MIVLRGLTWDHPRATTPLEAASVQWAERNPGVTVVWESRSLAAFTARVPAQTFGQYDLVIVDHPHMCAELRDGLVVDFRNHLDNTVLRLLERESVGPCFGSYVVDGSVAALPVDAAVQVSVHRHDLLPHPPETWEDVRALAAENQVVWPATGIANLLTVAANHGSRIGFDGDLVDAEIGTDAIELLWDLARAIPDWCLNASPIDVCEVLATTDRFSYCPLLYGYVNYSHKGFRPNRLTFGPMPSGPLGQRGSVLGGAGIAVSTASLHVAQAARFAAWVSSAECQGAVYETTGGQPSNRAAWDSASADARSEGFYSRTRRTVEEALVRPKTAWWPRYQAWAADLVSKHLRGRASHHRPLVEELNARFRMEVREESGSRW